MKNISKARRRNLGRVKRIAAGKLWIKEYRGNNVINDYVKTFGINEISALNDLEALGKTFDESYKKEIIEKVAKIEEQKRKTNERHKKIKEQKEFERMSENSDGDFYFIADYTSGGAPYGVTWEEMGIDSDLPFEIKVRKKMKNKIINQENYDEKIRY